MPTSRLRGSGRDAAGEQLARGAVARMPRGAGRDEVAQAGEARIGARVGAERRAQARHLGQPARDQRRAGVVAVSRGRRRCPRRSRSRSWRRRRAAPRARRRTRRRGSASVESARCRVQATSASVLATTLAAGCPGGDLLGVIRARERRDARRVVPRGLDDHVRQQAVRRGIEALGERDHERLGSQAQTGGGLGVGRRGQRERDQLGPGRLAAEIEQHGRTASSSRMPGR